MKIAKSVILLGSEHRGMRKNFETEMWVNGRELPLNHFVQESLANIIIGFLQSLKEADKTPEKIEVKIRRLTDEKSVDAHTYP